MLLGSSRSGTYGSRNCRNRTIWTGPVGAFVVGIVVGVAATVVVVAVVSGGVAVVGAVSLMLMEALSMSKPLTFEA